MKVLIFITFILFAGLNARSQNNYSPGSVLIIDNTNLSDDFVDRIKKNIDNEVYLKNKIFMGDPESWTVLKRKVSAQQSYYLPHGAFLIVFQINNVSGGSMDKRNLSVQIMNLKTGENKIISDQNVFLKELDEAMDLIINQHLKEILAGKSWKHQLNIYDNSKEAGECDSYNRCFKAFFVNKYLNGKFYIVRNTNKLGEEIKCSIDPAKSKVKFVLFKDDIEKDYFVMQGCNSSLNGFDDYCKKIIKSIDEN